MAGLISQAQALEKALKGSVIQMDRLQALRLRGGFAGVDEFRGLNAARTAAGAAGVGSRSTGGISPEEARAQELARRAAQQRKFDEAFIRAQEGATRNRGRQLNLTLLQQVIDTLNRLNGTLDRNDSRTGGGL